MPSVILHIGLPRTGTTLVQQWLDAGSPALREARITPIGSMAAHRIAVAFIAEAYRERIDVVRIRQAFDLEEAYGRAARADGVALVSSEYFTSADPAEVAQEFAERGLQVEKIICFVRRQDALQVSSYAQNVRMIGETGLPVAVGYHEAQDWNLHVQRWARSFPAAAMELRSYDKASREGVLASFCGCLGLGPDAAPSETKRVNATMSAEFTEIARMLNLRGIAFDGDKLLALDAASGGPAFGFPQSEIDIIEAAFGPSNAALAARVPDEFAEFARPGWTTGGIDMTGQVDEHRMHEILEKLRET